MGATAAWGDVLDPASLHNPMSGSSLVLHIAGLYRLGQVDHGECEAINVDGTRNVLECAAALKIPRIVYVSSIAIFGDTHRRLAVETDRMPVGQPFISAYDRSKWLALHQVVEPLVNKGVPIITIIPSAVFGPGDTSLVGQIMRAFLQGWLILFPGPETYLSLTYRDDAVQGILLAAELGRAGERYILAGDTVSLRQAGRLWVKITGWPAPGAYVPAALIHRLEGLSRLLEQIIPRWPEILRPGAIRVLGVSYAGRSDKARMELGWRPRPLEEGLRQTFDWMMRQPGVPTHVNAVRRRQTMIISAGLLVLASLIQLTRWLLIDHRSAKWRGTGP